MWFRLHRVFRDAVLGVVLKKASRNPTKEKDTANDEKSNKSGGDLHGASDQMALFFLENAENDERAGPDG